MRSLGNKKTVEEIDVAGKTVLVRVDFNVPFHPGHIEISDDSRIRRSLPTLRYLVKRRCKVVICSHLGRPDGKVVADLSMAPVSRRLSQLLVAPVAQAQGCVGPEVERAVARLGPGEAIMLENLRFDPGEEKNDPGFASALASLAEIYVNDAFGTAHRAHASTEGVTQSVPSVAGLLMARELEMLGRTLESPERPFAAILGGAKVSDKVGVIENLAGRVDTLIIGGAMAATFLKGKGIETGDSLVEEDRLRFAREIVQTFRQRGLKLLFPVDVVIADAFSESAGYRTVDTGAIRPGWRIMDIGPRTIELFEEALAPCRTAIWNGPLGVFEWEPFSQGTARIARALAGLDRATTVVGGGSTAEAVESLGLTDKMTHVSTGGGASLQFLEGRELPGVAALLDREKEPSIEQSV